MATSTERVHACLNIMRRMPPANIEANLERLLDLAPEEAEELLQRIDQPLATETCPATGRKYIKCDYNRFGDSFRSPWTNKYHPALEDESEVDLLPDHLRKLEVEANELFDVYRELYFEQGTASVYVWELDAGAFACCWLVRKDTGGTRHLKQGSWNSIHVVEVREASGARATATYKLTTTVLLFTQVGNDDVGSMDLSGSLTRQAEQTLPVGGDNTHVANIGGMIEEMESRVLSSLDGVYVIKTEAGLDAVRHLRTGPTASADFVASLSEAVRSGRRSAE